MTYRVTFSKTGALIFVSHLDFSHSVVRALKRAQLPLKYSEGFSPHPKLVFGLPLSVGTVGLNEIVDITLNCDDISNEEFARRFSSALTDDIVIKSVEQPTIKLGKIKSALYSITFEGDEALAKSINDAFGKLPQVSKKTKSGKEKMLDVNPLIFSLCAKLSDNKVTLAAELSSSGEAYLGPEVMLQAIKTAVIEIPEDYDIVREKIIFAE